jgi:hypothetical protein
MENIDKNSVFWNHMSDEEKKLFGEITQNASNIMDANESNIIENDIKASDEILNEIKEMNLEEEEEETDALD